MFKNNKNLIYNSDLELINKERKESLLKITTIVTYSFLFFTLFFNLFNIFIGSRVVVSGESMYPTLYDGESVFLNKAYYHFNKPNYNDIIVFDSHDNEDDYFVKRIVGLPGDTVEILNDKLYINGKLVNERYLKNDYVNRFKKVNNSYFTFDFSLKTNVYNDSENYFSSLSIKKFNNLDVKNNLIIIPKGYYFVLGDNRINSLDSREIGLIDKSSIRGKVYH